MHHTISCMHLSWLSSLICYTGPHTSHSKPSQSSSMLSFTRVHILMQPLVKTYLSSLVHPEMTVIPSWILEVAYLLVLVPFWELGLHLTLRLLHQRKECWYIWRHLPLLSFRFACLHILRILSNILSWSLPYWLKPSITMSPEMP